LDHAYNDWDVSFQGHCVSGTIDVEEQGSQKFVRAHIVSGRPHPIIVVLDTLCCVGAAQGFLVNAEIKGCSWIAISMYAYENNKNIHHYKFFKTEIRCKILAERGRGW